MKLREAEPTQTAGLAFSGGGIRSATFCLGVLQSLASRDLLKRFDYLSTVSGGGYIGGSLTWLVSAIANGKFSVRKASLPYGVKDPTETREAKGTLLHLRRKGNYLTPGGGLTGFSLANSVLRGIALNLVLWVPILILFSSLVLWLTNGIWRSIVDGNPKAWTWNLVQVDGGAVVAKDGTFDGLHVLLGVLAGALLFSAIAYSIVSRLPMGVLRHRYWARRWVDRWARIPIAVTIGLAVVSSLPFAHAGLHDYIAETGLASALIGILGGLRAFFRSDQKGGGGVSPGVAGVLGLFLIYGLGLLVYGGALKLIAAFTVLGYTHVLFTPIASTPWLWVALPTLLLVMLFVVDLNYISVHRYYRDRLMEAFMPDPEKVKDETEAAQHAGQPRSADGADKAPIAGCDHDTGPYQIVNTNVVLADSKKRRFEIRGGDNFILSPHYCGSQATGWLSTSEFMKGRLTLATAVAISGAALHPNAGVGGEGPTRNKPLSMMMSLLNLRLGYWIPNPRLKWQGARPSHLTAFLYEVLWRGYREDSDFLQISDGGHFENLAVYELIRRKAKLIVCCDGGEDREFTFSDLQVLARRIDRDFQARLLFARGQHLEEIIPDRDMTYPVGARSTRQAHIFGTIQYNDGTKGLFVLMKTAMLDDVGIRLKGYKGKNPEFPDESTADQFFDEEQFDAYRELGFRIAEKMIEDRWFSFEEYKPTEAQQKKVSAGEETRFEQYLKHVVPDRP